MTLVKASTDATLSYLTEMTYKSYLQILSHVMQCNRQSQQCLYHNVMLQPNLNYSENTPRLSCLGLQSPIKYKKTWILTQTSRSLSAKLMHSADMARMIATSDCIVLLYTTGLNCLLSSLVKPPSWMILQQHNQQNIIMKSYSHAYTQVTITIPILKNSLKLLNISKPLPFQ